MHFLTKLAWRDSIALLTLDDGTGRNALSLQMRSELDEQLQHLLGDKVCSAIVLTGAENFCFGGDLRQMDVKTRQEALSRLELVHRIIRQVASSAKPVLTAVQGIAAGGGVSLVAGSDYAVAARTARFSGSFLRAGLIPDMGALATVSRRMGMARARQFFCLGTTLSASDAFAAGLVDQVVEPPDVLDTTVAIAEQMAALPPLAFSAFKAAFADHSASLGQALEAEKHFQPGLLTSQDQKEAVTAFLDKRRPVFTGS